MGERVPTARRRLSGGGVVFSAISRFWTVGGSLKGFYNCRRVARGRGIILEWDTAVRCSGRRAHRSGVEAAARSHRGLAVGCVGLQFLDHEMHEDEAVL
jgi:hypothetical protein